jgi:3-isopropylmalate dehydrogenase
MNYTIAVLPGDGIGPEVIHQAIRVMNSVNDRFGIRFDVQYADFGGCSIEKHGVPLTLETLELCKSADAVLLGAIGDPRFDNDPSSAVRPEQGLLALRKELGLHTNVRPLTCYDAALKASPVKESVLHGVDFVIFRELTGGLYFGEKKLSNDGTLASDLCTYSATEIERIAKRAFESAMNRRKKLTLVDKANVLETSRLWRRTVQRMKENYPEVTVDFLFVDNAAMQMILNPGQFDVVLTENLFGDILSDLSGVLSGSIGLLPSASLGDTHALFEPVHGSYPQAARKDIANPVGTILSLALLYDHFGFHSQADLIRKAVSWCMQHGVTTPDIEKRNPAYCSQVGECIALYIESEGENAPFSFMKQGATII